MFKSPARMILSYLPNVWGTVSKKNVPLFLNNGKFKTYSFNVFRFKAVHLLRDKTFSNKNHFPSSLGVSISPERWKLIHFYFELESSLKLESSFVSSMHSTSIFAFFKSLLNHSHKKRKDSLETRAEPAVFSLQLELLRT